jgi:predicted ribosomally synthesized peptide with SipW-like signal peptide
MSPARWRGLLAAALVTLAAGLSATAGTTYASLNDREVTPVQSFAAATWTPDAPAECTRVFGRNLHAVWGTPGNDVLYGTNKRDVIYGRGGNDVIYGDNQGDCLIGGQGDDVLHGGNSADVLIGGPGRDVLYGNNGGDYLYGDADDDFLYGGNAPDSLDGGDGFDYCSGGNGVDIQVACEAGSA